LGRYEVIDLQVVQSKLTKYLWKQGRGKFNYKTDSEKDIIIVKWMDNKCVLIGSTKYGIQPATTIKRYSKPHKQKVDVVCPSIIKNYNKHMGGMVEANALMGLYKTPGKAKRWYFPIFTFLLDIWMITQQLMLRKF
jgi:hypothetical protein